MRSSVSIPAVSPDRGLNAYFAQIKSFPILSAEEEYMLAKRYQEHGDPDAAGQLVTSHLRLVAKIAMRYRGYGLPASDLIAEGNVGLMHGVKKFDPDRGFRLATYAAWWIKASIQDFILRSWSLVKLGTTRAQKKLFFNLRRLKKHLAVYDDGDLSPSVASEIAGKLGVSESETVSVNRRMLQGGDASLNVPFGDGADGQWQDLLTDNQPLQDELLADAEQSRLRRSLLQDALSMLSERERHILYERRLSDEPKTLEDLSEIYKVSRERIRQIEVRSFEKVQQAIKRMIEERGLVEACDCELIQ